MTLSLSAIVVSFEPHYMERIVLATGLGKPHCRPESAVTSDVFNLKFLKSNELNLKLSVHPPWPIVLIFL